VSYIRMPWYIFPTSDGVSFDMTEVPNQTLNVWLALLADDRDDELQRRIEHGRAALNGDETPFVLYPNLSR
jgi:hypothetical protein